MPAVVAAGVTRHGAISGVCSRRGNTNGLAASASSYLRTSAGDDIEWQPWSDEAFASEPEKLRFVAIGFAACHNCHRMHSECFENPVVCDLLRRYVSIKVDREEHGEVGSVKPELQQA